MGSMSSPANNASRIFPTIPRGEVIGRYDNYLDAQKVVDYLADNDFPVSNVSIIGNDLKQVERVRGKLSYPRVAGQGALQGAVIGLFFGILLSLFGTSGTWNIAPMLAGMLLGAVLFMLMNVVNYAMQRGKRDFDSTSQILPSSWDVVVEHSVANQAKQLASKLPMTPSQAAQRTGWSASGPSGVHLPGPGTDAGEYQPPAGGAMPQQPAPPASPSQAFGYDDLDDGRPRYGVRLDQVAPPAPEGPAPVAPAALASAVAPVSPAAPHQVDNHQPDGASQAAHAAPASADVATQAMPEVTPAAAEPAWQQAAAPAEPGQEASGAEASGAAAWGADDGAVAPQESEHDDEAPLSRREARALEEREQQDRLDRERAERLQMAAEPPTQVFTQPEVATQALPTLPVVTFPAASAPAPLVEEEWQESAPAAVAAEQAAEEPVAPVYPPIQPPVQVPLPGEQSFGVAPPVIQPPAAPAEEPGYGQDQEGQR